MRTSLYYGKSWVIFLVGLLATHSISCARWGGDLQGALSKKSSLLESGAPSFVGGALALWTSLPGGVNTNGRAATYASNGPNAANFPGGRNAGASWMGSDGSLWLFGGYGGGDLNDLWKFDGSVWSWVSGSSSKDQPGNYGTIKVTASSNVPGARHWPASWKDSLGNFWLFGGYGYDSAGSFGALNDLWKFDGTNWTWVSGSKFISQLGNYGMMGNTQTTNVPGARWGSVAWTSGNDLWLFGGLEFNLGTHHNDVWKFDGTNWTWMSGSQNGATSNYGTQGTPSLGNLPPGRAYSTGWVDAGRRRRRRSRCSHRKSHTSRPFGQ